MGLDFEYACDTYLKDLKEEVNFGASILDAAIKLSLKYLDSELKKLTKSANLASEYSMYEMYKSLCVFEKHQRMPVTVLARLWRVDDKFAERIALLISSMSSGRISIHKNDAGEKESGLNSHDLHLDFFLQQVLGDSEVENWHFRLLQSHMPLLADSKCELIDFGTCLSEILQYQPQNWLPESLWNKEYMLQALTRHFLGAGLIFELWALVLDPKWMHAQVNACTGGMSALQRDFSFFREVFGDELSDRNSYC